MLFWRVIGLLSLLWGVALYSLLFSRKKAKKKLPPVRSPTLFIPETSQEKEQLPYEADELYPLSEVSKTTIQYADIYNILKS